MCFLYLHGEKLATFIDGALPIIAAILGQVDQMTGIQNVNTASKVLKNSPKPIALSNSMGDLSSKSFHSPSQRAPKKHVTRKQELEEPTSSTSEMNFRGKLTNKSTRKYTPLQPEEKGDETLIPQPLETTGTPLHKIPRSVKDRS